MAIKDVSVVVSYIVETDHPVWPTYRRNGKDSWEQLMGMSWEEVLECEEIEEEFQREKNQFSLTIGSSKLAESWRKNSIG